MSGRCIRTLDLTFRIERSSRLRIVLAKVQHANRHSKSSTTHTRNTAAPYAHAFQTTSTHVSLLSGLPLNWLPVTASVYHLRHPLLCLFGGLLA